MKTTLCLRSEVSTLHDNTHQSHYYYCTLYPKLLTMHLFHHNVRAKYTHGAAASQAPKAIT